MSGSYPAMNRDIKCAVRIISPYVHDAVRQQCVECINRCPARALSIDKIDGKELLSHDTGKCFSCGDCVRLVALDTPYICELLEPVSHITRIDKWKDAKLDFGFLIGPGLEYYSERINLKQVVTACRRIGAKQVYRTSDAIWPAFGAIKDEIIKRWKEGDNLLIDSRCGAIRNYIYKCRPDLSNKLVMSNSTLFESAKLARQNDDKYFRLCFVGPDIAYKETIFHHSKHKLVNAVLTWHEFDQLCDDKLAEPIYELAESDFDKFFVNNETAYPPPGTLDLQEILKKKGVPYITMAGKNKSEIISFFRKLNNYDTVGFIEVLLCGSCIHGPGVFSTWSGEQQRADIRLRKKEPQTTSVIEELYLIVEGDIAMDVFKNIHESTIVSRSKVENSFNRVRQQHSADVADALVRLAEVVAQSQNRQAGELLDAFNEELAKEKPKKAVLESVWGSLVKALPTISQMTDVVGRITGLFAI